MSAITTRRLANAGPLVRYAFLLLGWLFGQHVLRAQSDPQGWRALLIGKAAGVKEAPASGEDVQAAVKSAVAAIDALSGTDQDVPEHVRQLADSIVAELYAYEARIHIAESHPANAVVAFREALARMEGLPGQSGRARDLTDALVSAQQKAGDQGAALKSYDDAIRKAEAAKDDDGARYYLVQKALLLSEAGEYRDAITINTRVLAMDSLSGDVGNEIDTELRLSRNHEKLNGAEAFAHAKRAYELAEKNGLDRSLLKACDHLIGSYQNTADRTNCKTMLDRALALTDKRGIKTEQARIHDRFGRFHMKDTAYSDAEQQFLTGLSVLGYEEAAENPFTGNAEADRCMAELLLDIGHCYREMGKADKALIHLSQCENLLKSDPALEVYPWADLGELYLDLDQVPKASEYGAKALEAAEARSDNELERSATGLLYRIYERQGKWEQALRMHERFMDLSLPKNGEDYKLELQRTQLNITFSEKQLTDSMASARVTEGYRQESKQRETRTYYLIIGGIILFLAMMIVALFDRKRRMARFDREAAQLETQALRSQMNPHFIFNALNSINAFVQKNEPDKAASFLSRFARLMRLVLENSRQAEVPLKDDLEALDAYLHLERTRTGEKFDYRIQVAADIDPEDVMVPPLVAQPFVENAIWHGMSGKEEKGLITLSVSRKGDQLLFAIEDDGVGRSSPKRMASMGESDPHNAPTKKTSLGTAITKARLDLVRQQKGKAAGFIYVDLPQGTRVELTLPFSTAA